MLNIVPKTINKSSRLVTLKHPNSMGCFVFRKKITRNTLSSSNPVELVGGLPTLGGAGVLSGGDEAEFTYEYVTGDFNTSDGKVLFCGVHEPHDFLDSDLDGNAFLEPTAYVEALIESSSEGAFTVDSNDLIAIHFDVGVVLMYEVKKPVGTVNVAPFTRKYVLQARDDLDHIASVATKNTRESF